MNDGQNTADWGDPRGAVVGTNPVRLWGMSSAERLRRQFVRAEIPADGPWSGEADGPMVLASADWVFDEALIRDLIKAPGTVLVAPGTDIPVAGHVAAADAPALADHIDRGLSLPAAVKEQLRVVGPDGLTGTYNNALRKKEPPFLLHLTEENLRAVENRMFAGSYKGVTDLVTKYVWPWPAQRVTKACALMGITPNQVTLLSAVLVVAAFFLFLNGWFLTGLACAWGMTFLDTVDGKLARVTLTSSKWGNVFDHGIDLIHPPFWYWAWISGLAMLNTPVPAEGLVAAIVIGGYVAQRLQEGLFLALYKIEIHIWRPFDSFFRLITARRNPNLLLLTGFTLAGMPGAGMVAVAVWTVASFAVHCWQIVEAWRASRQGPITSWLSR